MKELLDTYSTEGELVGQKEKKAAHEEMREEFLRTGKVSTRHKTVRLFLLTSQGRVILQRRSKWKGDNPGLWDKTIGGHVSSGEGFDLTMLKECAEELGIPSTIVKDDEFENAITTTDLNILAILRRASYLDNFQSKRTDKEGNVWVEPSMTQVYVGYYDGAIRFIDKESCGIQVFSKEELEKEIEKSPDSFTEDVKYMIEKFGNFIKPLKIVYKKILND